MQKSNLSRQLTYSLVVFFSIALFPFMAFSQGAVSNIQATEQDNLILITYDLKPYNGYEDFSIEILCSHDNYQTPLSQIEGDVGKGISSQQEKKSISWTYAGELIGANTDLKFQIIAIPTVSPDQTIKVILARGRSVLRKEGKYAITWTGVPAEVPVSITLLLNGVELKEITTLSPGENSYTWAIPLDLETTKGYQIQISEKGQMITPGISESFEIMNSGLISKFFPNNPAIAKIVTITRFGLVGFVSYYLFLRPDSDLPGAPDINLWK